MPPRFFVRTTLLPIATFVALPLGGIAAQSDTALRSDSLRARGLDAVRVTGRADDLRGIASSASQGRVGSADLRLRPLMREGELLETVPGLIVTQHSGDGKANQYFVRGFNLDHGTDFATRVEGMPINMPSHAHGQGYTDVNFLIPELVDYIDYRLGPYHAELGDFGSAGGAEVHLLRKLDRPFVTLGAGEHGLARVAMGTSGRVGAGDLLFAGEVKSYDGPWVEPEKARKASGQTRYTWGTDASRFSLLGMAYRSTWRSTDQIPLRAVNSGIIDRFGHVDGSDGGNTQRYSLSGSWRRVGASGAQEVQLFAVYSDLSLYSNFTYFLDNPDQGDQFNQRERRVVLGGNVKHTRAVQALGSAHVVTIGSQIRGDLLSPVGLYRTHDRVRRVTVRQDNVTENAVGFFSQVESGWSDWLRTTLGLRGDLYSFDVKSDLAANSGERTAGVISPKASVIFVPTRETEIYASAGMGFHSNDARGTTITVDPMTREPTPRVDPIVRSRGAEVGLRANPLPSWRSTLAVWRLDLDSELLFVGDGGSTEPSDESRRSGVTWANFYRPIAQLTVDADLSLARARFTGVPSNADHVPGALENVVAGGITWAPPVAGVFGSVRVRHFGSYPLVEDNSVRAVGTTLLNADGGLSLHGLRVQLTVLNLLNERANDIQYYYRSRLPGEPAAGVDDVHFHPVEPRQLRVSFDWGF